jgi:hypothetical protein|nr:MAG TPA: NADH dehydrogenase 1 beta subcomplex subunit 2 [Caudoviricetes sp.]
MKTFFKFLGACACGTLWGWMFYTAFDQDNDELQAGKSPHSGFTPDCPKAFDGFSKPSRSPRTGESNNQ